MQMDQSPGKIETMDHDLVDAKIATSEARADAKFAELRGEVRSGLAEVTGEIRTMRQEFIGEMKAMRTELSGRMDQIEKSTTGLRWNIWGSVLVIAGLIIAMFSFSGSQIGLGLNFGSQVESAVKSEVSRQIPPPPPAVAKPD
ncbi:hypothetical protein [Xanthobacter agilis]|uniref:Uncharacterized protein n=1 Tax=Xanthobacter agilis TaxID=47492 RepID=A0ABU0LFY3_XANAG|nr:hypothetical protein [Xanthobacter agilis]MDQ0505982.1 hypothetical protein [Xanthobacter agilis]